MATEEGALDQIVRAKGLEQETRWLEELISTEEGRKIYLRHLNTRYLDLGKIAAAQKQAGEDTSRVVSKSIVIDKLGTGNVMMKVGGEPAGLDIQKSQESSGVLMSIEQGPIRFQLDQSELTKETGHQLRTGDTIVIKGSPNVTRLRMISDSDKEGLCSITFLHG